MSNWSITLVLDESEVKALYAVLGAAGVADYEANHSLAEQLDARTWEADQANEIERGLTQQREGK